RESRLGERLYYIRVAGSSASLQTSSQIIPRIDELRHWKLEQRIHFLIQLGVYFVSRDFCLGVSPFTLFHDGLSLSLFARKTQSECGLQPNGLPCEVPFVMLESNGITTIPSAQANLQNQDLIETFQPVGRHQSQNL